MCAEYYSQEQFAMYKYLTLLFVAQIFFITAILGADTASIPKNRIVTFSPVRPKIGLVLSGGGAKGLAHIGVLKVLEEMGIRPDYIAGTSMGSLIGGLYAIGYSADELDSIAKTMDWGKMLSDQMPLYDVNMDEKQYFNNYISEFTFDDTKGLSLPSGLVHGQKVHAKFSSLSWRTAGVESFDSFPIPFRCVATDLLSGRPVVFDHGDLTNAMRASMSIPSAFAPVKLDTMLLIDGGVTRNYPVEEVKSMGADIVIGVYVGTNRKLQSNELLSLVDILGHTAFLGGVKDSEEQMKYVDIEIIPDLANIGSDNFNKAADIVKLGERAARLMTPQFAALASQQHIFASEPPKALPRNDSLYVDVIEYIGNDNIDVALLNDLSLLKADEYYCPEKISKSIERLYGSGFFDKITYQFKPSETGNYKLVITLFMKPKGAIKFGVKYDSYFDLAAKVNLIFKSTVLKNDKVFIPAEIGPNPQIKVQYQKTVNDINNMVAYAYGQFEANDVPFYSLSDTVNVSLGRKYQLYFRYGAGSNYSINTRNAFGLEWQNNVCKQLYKDGLDQQKKIKYLKFGNSKVEAHYRHNSLDRHYFQQSGRTLNIIASMTYNPVTSTYYTRDSTIRQSTGGDYYQVYADYSKVFHIDHLYFKPWVATAYSWGAPQDMDMYFLGGDHNLSRFNTLAFYGYRNYRLISHTFYMASLDMYANVSPDNFILLGANYARFYDDIDRDLLDFTESNASGFMIGYGMLTKFGPVSAKWTQSPQTDGMLLLNFGFQL